MPKTTFCRGVPYPSNKWEDMGECTKELTQSTNIGRNSSRLGISSFFSMKYRVFAYIMPTSGFSIEAYFNNAFEISEGIPSFDAALDVFGVLRGEDMA